jgi:hypothetical protein
VPTATHQADPANPLDRSSGDRQWDFSLQGVQSFKPVSRLNLSWSTKLTWQLQDSEQRYLAARNDPLPPKVNDPESAFAVTRDLGDLIETEVSASSSFVNSLLNPYAAYQYAYKGADSYSAAVDRDVDRLSQKTQTQSHRFEVGLTVSTVSRAIEGNVKLPVELKVAWNQNLSGQNVPRAHYGRIDLVLFF